MVEGDAVGCAILEALGGFWEGWKEGLHQVMGKGDGGIVRDSGGILTQGMRF